MQKTIKVTISPDGGLSVKSEGFAGAECLQTTKFLEDALGEVEHEAKTAEFFSEVEQKSQQWARQ